MPATYQAESFYRAKISSSIAQAQTCPITIRLSKLPVRTSGLLTISPNTENEEIVEYGNINVGNMTIDITKRGINPSSTLLTTNGTDYNNPSFQKDHSQNEVIRGDVNHIHINQSVANTVLATNTGVGISKLSVAAADPNDPIVVGTNDPRLATYVPPKASTSTLGVTKISTAPADANNPIAVGDNDPRLGLKVATGYLAINTSNTTPITFTCGFQPKRVRVVTSAGGGGPFSDTTSYYNGTSVSINGFFVENSRVTSGPYTALQGMVEEPTVYVSIVRDRKDGNLVNSIYINTLTVNATGFVLSAPIFTGYGTGRIFWEALG